MIKPISGIKIYGDLSYRDKRCPKESVEQITFTNRVRKEFPDTHGRTLFHAKNEGKLIKGQFQAITKDKAMGMVTGCVDIHDHGNPSFCMELKRKDHLPFSRLGLIFRSVGLFLYNTIFKLSS